MVSIATAGSRRLLSRIALGCEPLGGTDWGEIDEEQAVGAVRRALEVGITTFDTADIYGLGRGEIALAEALGARRHEVVIVSKGGIRWEKQNGTGRAMTFRDSRPTYLETALENSLRRLKIECIPIYLIHWPDPATPLDETIDALVHFKSQGKIGAFGLSNFDAEDIRRGLGYGPIMFVEHPYSLADRKCEAEVFPAADEHGLAVLVYGVLSQGLLTGKYRPGHPFPPSDRRSRLPHFRPSEWSSHEQLLRTISDVAGRHGTTMAQVAIHWALINNTVACAVVGAKRADQVDANAQALELKLDEDDLRELETASRFSKART